MKITQSGGVGTPGFLKLLFFVELWERFSYYGMRALLVLFLTSHLGFSDPKAYSIYSVFAAISYAVPIIGGILADRFLGFRNMIIIGGIIMTLGHAIMVAVAINPNLIFLGLALIAIGTGLFKGNITNLLGACYINDDENRSKGFTLFYVSVNIGSFLASVSCGYVASIYGWHYGFGLAGIGMGIGMFVFLKYQHILGTNGLLLRENSYIIISMVFVLSIVTAFFVSKMLLFSEDFADFLKYFGLIAMITFVSICLKQDKEQVKKLIALSILIIFTMLFFALEMQLGSLINLFANRNIQTKIFGFAVPAALSQAINPLSIMILGLLIGRYVNFNKKYDIHKFAFGIFTMAICFGILYLGCINADLEGKVSYAYLVTGLGFMGLGELLIAPFVQSQATILAPKHLKGFIMGFLMLSLAFSNLAGIVISKFMSVPSIDGEVNSLVSLEIYKAGFLEIAEINVLFTIIFLLSYKFLKKVIF